MNELINFSLLTTFWLAPKNALRRVWPAILLTLWVSTALALPTGVASSWLKSIKKCTSIMVSAIPHSETAEMVEAKAKLQKELVRSFDGTESIFLALKTPDAFKVSGEVDKKILLKRLTFFQRHFFNFTYEAFLSLPNPNIIDSLGFHDYLQKGGLTWANVQALFPGKEINGVLDSVFTDLTLKERDLEGAGLHFYEPSFDEHITLEDEVLKNYTHEQRKILVRLIALAYNYPSLTRENYLKGTPFWDATIGAPPTEKIGDDDRYILKAGDTVLIGPENVVLKKFIGSGGEHTVYATNKIDELSILKIGGFPGHNKVEEAQKISEMSLPVLKISEPKKGYFFVEPIKKTGRDLLVDVLMGKAPKSSLDPLIDIYKRYFSLNGMVSDLNLDNIGETASGQWKISDWLEISENDNWKKNETKEKEFSKQIGKSFYTAWYRAKEQVPSGEMALLTTRSIELLSQIIETFGLQNFQELKPTLNLLDSPGSLGPSLQLVVMMRRHEGIYAMDLLSRMKNSFPPF